MSKGIVIDSSALAAMLLGEDEAKRITCAIVGADIRLVSAFSKLETTIVIVSKKGISGQQDLDALSERHNLEVTPLTPEQVKLGRKDFHHGLLALAAVTDGAAVLLHRMRREQIDRR